jgi:MFS family permease
VSRRVSPQSLLLLAVASQASVSIVQWGLGAFGKQLQDSYHVSAAGLGALLAASGVGTALALIPAGGLIDRIGVRVPLFVGGVGVAATLTAAGYARNVYALAGALLAFGLVGSLVAVAAPVSVFHAFPPEQRGWALGVRQMAVAMGGLLAAIVLPSLADLGGVRLAFAGTGIVAGIFAIVFGLACEHGPPPGSSRPPFRPLEVLALPGMRRLMTVGFLYVSVLTTVLSFASTAARHAGASKVEGSLIFAVISVAAMTARLVWGKLADRDGGARRRSALRDVGLVTVVGALVYWAASGLGVAFELPAIAFFAFGALGFNGLIYVIAGEISGPDRAGTAVGIASAVLFGGAALAAVPLGWLADTAGYRALWPADAVIAGIGVLVALGLRERSHEPVPAPARA